MWVRYCDFKLWFIFILKRTHRRQFKSGLDHVSVWSSPLHSLYRGVFSQVSIMFIVCSTNGPRLLIFILSQGQYNSIKARKTRCLPQDQNIFISCSGVGVTKPISSVPLFSYFLRIAKTHVSYSISCSYLTGVAAAQLRWHLSNMNVIEII